METTFWTQSDEKTPHGLWPTIQFALKQYGLLGTVGRVLLNRQDNRRFVDGAANPQERQFRRSLLKRFAQIQKHVTCPHSPYQFVLLAESILGLDLPGPMVECGCFKGGSTAKLSILAEQTGRKLYVCDSFCGLPEPESDDEAALKSANRGVPNIRFAAGEYSGSLDEVKNNVRNYGCLSACEFVPGFFADSLPDLNIQPAWVYIDVDLASSARDCLRNLWPRLQPGGYWFTHEASFPVYLEGMLDADFWNAELSQSPPTIYGAGSGLSINAASVAYMRKPSAAKLQAASPTA